MAIVLIGCHCNIQLPVLRIRQLVRRIVAAEQEWVRTLDQKSSTDWADDLTQDCFSLKKNI